MDRGLVFLIFLALHASTQAYVDLKIVHRGVLQQAEQPKPDEDDEMLIEIKANIDNLKKMFKLKFSLFESSLMKIESFMRKFEKALPKMEATMLRVDGSVMKVGMFVKGLERPLFKVRDTVNGMEASIHKLDTSSQTVETAIRKLESSQQGLKISIRKLESSSVNVESSVSKVEENSRGMKASLMKLEASQATVESAMRKLKIPIQIAGESAQRMEGALLKLKGPLQTLEGYAQRAELSLQKHKNTLVNLGTASQRVEVAIQKIKAPVQNLEDASQRVEASLKKLKTSATKVESFTTNMDASVHKIIGHLENLESADTRIHASVQGLSRCANSKQQSMMMQKCDGLFALFSQKFKPFFSNSNEMAIQMMKTATKFNMNFWLAFEKFLQAYSIQHPAPAPEPVARMVKKVKVIQRISAGSGSAEESSVQAMIAPQAMIAQAIVAPMVSTRQTTCIQGPVDVVFVMDESKSVNDYQFRQGLGACSGLVNKLNIGFRQTESRVGFVLFSSTARLIFNLRSYNTKRGVLGAIGRIRKMNGGTNIISGMQVALTKAFDRSANRATKVMLVITDGADNQGSRANPTIASLRKQANARGITVYALGVGKGPNTSQLFVIAGHQSRVHRVEDYESLSHVFNEMWCF